MLVALFLFRIVAIQYATGKPYMHTNIQIYSDTYKQTETNTQHTDIRIQSKRTRFTARELSMYFAIVGGLRARALSLSLSVELLAIIIIMMVFGVVVSAFGFFSYIARLLFSSSSSFYCAYVPVLYCYILGYAHTSTVLNLTNTISSLHKYIHVCLRMAIGKPVVLLFY